MIKKVFVTGGAGYIGSHTVIALLESGYEVVVYDNLSNSNIESINRIKKITNKSFDFIEGDIRDEKLLFESIKDSDSVIHFAGLKAVGESVSLPLKYYENNITGTLTLLKVMQKRDIKRLIFSSSASIYGEPQYLPIDEKHPINPTNPYSKSKYMIEEILKDIYISDSSWHIVSLRYFNPIGAHKSGEIGENPNDIPNNLMPYITQVASKKLDRLKVFGDDYDTIDGTGVRDYIHITDLVQGHIKALKKIDEFGYEAINLGTGRGYSVREIIETFERVNGVKIPYDIVDRRSGDVAISYADPSYAKEILGWEAKYGIEEMCRDAWRWQVKNPNGYESL